ncbi:unnamed protein product [Menidia menidia]|uniref:(Atlantic silverside) hypothetical protein n=1 Tax=Menidia menidia TaxID=238744 RepID=A0A8S4BJW0_9TELE|nr:unnamed protein product [Menidia menidia]
MHSGECLAEAAAVHLCNMTCDDCIWHLTFDLKKSNQTLDQLKVGVLNISTGAAANDRLKYYNYTAHRLQMEFQRWKNKSSVMKAQTDDLEWATETMVLDIRELAESESAPGRYSGLVLHLERWESEAEPGGVVQRGGIAGQTQNMSSESLRVLFILFFARPASALRPGDQQQTLPIVCKKGFFLSDRNVCLPCNCRGHADFCEDVTGVCINCKDHSAGDFCEMCEDGYFLTPGLDGHHSCKPCPCPLSIPSNR